MSNGFFGVRFWSNKYICIRPSTSQPSCSCTHVLSGGSWTMYIYISLSLCKKEIIAWEIIGKYYVGVYVLWSSLITSLVGSLARICFFLCWSSQRWKEWLDLQQKIIYVIGSKLSNKCWSSTGVYIRGRGGGGELAMCISPLLSLFLIFTPWPGVGLSCTFTYPKWHNLGLNAIDALGINTWSIHTSKSP